MNWVYEFFCASLFQSDNTVLGFVCHYLWDFVTETGLSTSLYKGQTSTLLTVSNLPLTVISNVCVQALTYYFIEGGDRLMFLIG